MTIDIARLRNGRLAMISDKPFPGNVRHIEYYKDQKLFQLVFQDDDADDLLITRELDTLSAKIVETAPEVMIVVMAQDGLTPYGYDVPLIQIGV